MGQGKTASVRDREHSCGRYLVALAHLRGFVPEMHQSSVRAKHPVDLPACQGSSD